MPTCPRCAALALVLAVLAFTGCDSSNPGRDLDVVDGVYTLAELTFDPATQGLPTADFADRLDMDGTILEIFGGDAEAQIRVRYVDGTPSERIELTVGATRGQATFEADQDDDRDDLATLFLPERFSLAYDEEFASQLSASFTQSGVDLEAFDPDIYRDQRSNRGTLTIRFARQ